MATSEPGCVGALFETGSELDFACRLWFANHPWLYNDDLKGASLVCWSQFIQLVRAQC